MAIKSFIENDLGKTPFSYIFSTKDRNNLEIYFKLKDKYEYRFQNEEFEELKKTIVNEFGTYDLVIIPETKGRYLKTIADSLSDNVISVSKRCKADILTDLEQQKMMKNEKQSLFNTLEEMDVVQINKIKGNQRKRFRDILFEKLDFTEWNNKKVLLLDDSVFSGETLIALKESINVDCEIKVIFSKF